MGFFGADNQCTTCCDYTHDPQFCVPTQSPSAVLPFPPFLFPMQFTRTIQYVMPSILDQAYMPLVPSLMEGVPILLRDASPEIVMPAVMDYFTPFQIPEPT